MKKVVLLLFSLLFAYNLNAQKKDILVEGKCFDIIEALRDYYKNDTLAINHFRDFYTAHSLSVSTSVELTQKTVDEAIRFFSDLRRRNFCICTLKGWREKNVLLDNRPN